MTNLILWLVGIILLLSTLTRLIPEPQPVDEWTWAQAEQVGRMTKMSTKEAYKWITTPAK